MSLNQLKKINNLIQFINKNNINLLRKKTITILHKNHFLFSSYLFFIKPLQTKRLYFPTLLGFSFGFSKTKPDGKKIEMSEEKSDLVDHLNNADQLFDENHYQDNYDLLKKYPDQNCPEIKWRLARCMYQIAKTLDKKKKEEMTLEAYKMASESLEQNDKDFAAHKWYAILLDSKSELIGIKERLTQMENVKKHMILAAELNPTDPTSQYLLGSFAFGLADLPWYQKKIVSTIFAKPPEASYEEALSYFLKAEELKENFFSSNLLMLGKCYMRLKDKATAKSYLERAKNYPEKNDADRKCKEEATQLLKSI